MAKKRKSSKKKWLWAIPLGIIVFLILISLALFSFDFTYEGKIYPRIKVANFSLGGLSKEEAERYLTSKFDELGEEKITLTYGDKFWEIDCASCQLHLVYDIPKTVEKAYRIGREGNFLANLYDQLSLLFGKKIQMEYSFDEEVLDSFLAKIASEIDQKPHEASLIFQDASLEIKDSQEGYLLEKDLAKELIKEKIGNLQFSSLSLPVKTIRPQITESEALFAQRQAASYLVPLFTLKTQEKNFRLSEVDIFSFLEFRKEEKGNEEIPEISEDLLSYTEHLYKKEIFSYKIVLKAHLSEAKIEKYLKKLALKIDQEAVNAQLTIKDGRAVVFRPDQDGQRVQIKEATSAIKEALGEGKTFLSLPLEKIAAKVRVGNINELGISKLIGRGVSSFSGSEYRRIHNIKTGATKLNGALIEPGGTFSFNEYVGPVSLEAGFVKGWVIKRNKVVLDYGGGLCQVATTFFRGAFFSGVPILERRPHSFRVSWYDYPYGPGLDATVDSPHPDVLIKNDTPAYILIQAYTKGYYLYFDFYGTSDGRKVKLSGPFTLFYKSDGSMSTVAYRLIYMGTKLIKKDTFYSYYDSPSKYPHLPN